MDESKPEIFFMVDIEASGPIPGDFSMLSLGAVVVGQHTPPYHKSFYVEMKPLPDAQVDSEAMEVNKLDIYQLEKTGAEPGMAMLNFRNWVIRQANPDVTRPVMVSMGTFDPMFIVWYFHHFYVRSPFTVNSMDLKSYYMGRFPATRWSQATSRSIKAKHPDWFTAPQGQAHNALDDALRQADWFHRMRQG